MGSVWRPMERADVVLNVMEDHPFIFKVSDLGEIIGKLEGIYLRGLKRRRGKELGAVLRGCWAGWTLDKKKTGRGEVPSVPGFVVRGLPLIHDKTVDEWGTEVLGYFMTGPPARWPGQVSHFWFSRDGLCPIQAASVAAWVGKHKGSPSVKRTPSGNWLPRPLIAKNAMNGAQFRLRNDRDTCPVGPWVCGSWSPTHPR